MRSSSLNAMLVLLALGGCATAPSGGQGPSTEDLAKIQTGVTSTGDVKALLGPPVRTSRFDRMDRDVWEYRRYNDPTQEYLVAVQFSRDGIAREVVVVKDYSREPCSP